MRRESTGGRLPDHLRTHAQNKSEIAGNAIDSSDPVDIVPRFVFALVVTEWTGDEIRSAQRALAFCQIAKQVKS